jgi:hypothetical protein
MGWLIKFYAELRSEKNIYKNYNEFRKLGCSMSLKFYFLHLEFNYFSENLNIHIDKQAENFHQVINKGG